MGKTRGCLQAYVVAQNFGAYIWLFANGLGPFEAVEYASPLSSSSHEFMAFAEEHAPSGKSTALEIIERAKTEFPDFEKKIDQLCK